MTHHKFASLIILTLALIVTLAGCVSLTGKAIHENTPTKITIGGIFALSGPGAEWGSAEREGVELAFAQANNDGGINGSDVQLQAQDSQTDPTMALTAFRKLADEEKIGIIIGPTWEASSQAVAPAANSARVLLIAPSAYKGIKEQQADMLFSTYPPLEHEVRATIPFMKEQNMKRVSVIYNDEAFSVAMKDIFVAMAKGQNISVVALHQQAGNNDDFRTILLKINAEGVDVVYAPLARNDPDAGALMRQAKQLGMNKTVISISSTENQNLLKNYGDDMERLVYPFPAQAKGYAAFSEQYTQQYGELPVSPSAAMAYDAANLILAALRSGANTPEEISTYLRGVKNYQGASNTITFLPDGTIANKEYIMKTVRGGEFVVY